MSPLFDAYATQDFVFPGVAHFIIWCPIRPLARVCPCVPCRDIWSMHRLLTVCYLLFHPFAFTLPMSCVQKEFLLNRIQLGHILSMPGLVIRQVLWKYLLFILFRFLWFCCSVSLCDLNIFKGLYWFYIGFFSVRDSYFSSYFGVIYACDGDLLVYFLLLERTSLCWVVFLFTICFQRISMNLSVLKPLYSQWGCHQVK